MCVESSCPLCPRRQPCSGFLVGEPERRACFACIGMFNVWPVVPLHTKTWVSPHFICCIWKAGLSQVSTQAEVPSWQFPSVWHFLRRPPAFRGRFLVPTESLSSDAKGWALLMAGRPHPGTSQASEDRSKHTVSEPPSPHTGLQCPLLGEEATGTVELLESELPGNWKCLI